MHLSEITEARSATVQAPLFLRRSVSAATDSRNRGDFCSGVRDRTGSKEGIADVVDLLMSAAIAPAEINRRHPMTTLVSAPVRNMA